MESIDGMHEILGIGPASEDLLLWDRALTEGRVVNEISGQVNYKILPWLGAGAGIGYRNLWNGDQRIKNTLEATIYIFKLICYPENIF